MHFIRLPGLTGNPLTAQPRLDPLPTWPDEVTTPAEAFARACHLLRDAHDDDWTAFTGFFLNFRRTDLVVAGPAGVVAVRFVYASHALVTAEGNWQLRFDRFEGAPNMLDLVVPPPALLNLAADDIHRGLKPRLPLNHVVRAIVLVDPQAALDLVRPSCVDFVGRPEDFDAAGLCTLLKALSRPQDGDDVAQAVADLHWNYVVGGARNRPVSR